MKKLWHWIMRLFAQPEAVPPALNRKDRRCRQSVARRKAQQIARAQYNKQMEHKL